MNANVQPDIAAAGSLANRGDPMPLCRLLWPGIVLDRHQLDMIRCGLSGEFAEIYAKGCTASGKTTAAAILAVLWFVLFEVSKIVLTSQRFEHCRDVLFSEIATWAKQARLSVPGTIGREGIYHHEAHKLTIANPESGEGFSGQHSSSGRTLFIFDEATSIPDEFRDLASTQARLIVALANPRALSGWFKRGFPVDRPNETCTVVSPFGQRRCITIDGADCINVREGRQIIPGQLSRERFNGLLAHHNPRWVEIFAHGRFPDEDEELQVILGTWLPRHISAWAETLPVTAFGLDVAASMNGDATVLAAGGPRGCTRLHMRKHRDTMNTVGWVVQTAREVHGIDLTAGRNPVVVDGDGLGIGVAQRLAELGVAVRPFRGNGTAANSKQYANARAEAYGELGRQLNPAGPWGNSTWAIPDDPLLAAELCAPEKIYTSDGIKFHITPKARAGSRFAGETLVEKLGRSPDRADGLVYLYAAVRDFAIHFQGLPSESDDGFTIEATGTGPATMTADQLRHLQQNPSSAGPRFVQA